MAAYVQSQQLPNFDSLWNYRDLKGTAQAFRDLIPQAEAAKDRSYLAQLLTQLARTSSLQSDFEECHKVLDRVEAMLTDDLKLARVRYYLERGRAFNSAGEQLKAMPLFTAAFTLADSIGERSFSIDALHMVAIADSNPAEKITWNLKAIELAEREPQVKSWLFPLYNNIGDCYGAVNNYQQAQIYFHKLNQLYRSAGKEPNMYSMKDEARMLRLLGKPAESLAMMEPIDKKFSDDNNEDGWISEEMAEALFALGRTEEAAPHFKTAYNILSMDEWVVKNDPDKLKRLSEMAGK